MQRVDVAAVIVSYMPDGRLFEALEALVPQVARILVVDNGSPPETVARLRQYSNGDSIQLVLNAGNLGLAAAQNQGIRLALDGGADWVLLLDDDSIPAPDMVAAMLAAHDRYATPENGKAGRVGLVAPLLDDAEGTLKARTYVSRHAFELRRVGFGGGDVVEDVAFTMASGSLVKAGVFRDTGLMREDFFVDYIDFEFAFRMRREGWKLISVGAARLQHRLGECERKRMFGHEFSFNSHSSFRRYHIYRNRLRVWRAHGLRLPAFFIFEAASIAIDLGKLILLEDDKLAKLAAIGRGVVDAVLGRNDHSYRLARRHEDPA